VPETAVPETAVLLHGFSGTRRAWDGVASRLDPERYLPLALDLPGHGELASQPWPICFEDCVRMVLDASPERFVLCGYSLGGRVAMHVALAAPERVSRLVLIAANPGIEDRAERAARLAADERLAQRLETEPFEQWIESWRTQPLFAADPPHVGELARADQRRNEPLALAAAMRGLSVGAMAPLWGRLGELAMPVVYVVGERDEKFRAIGELLAAECPGCTLSVVQGGHGLPLENPDAVASAIQPPRLSHGASRP
jgi:2-succinyl-6-hydroxy-2,4-cyclohexadiene-1-carboxylate synthase